MRNKFMTGQMNQHHSYYYMDTKSSQYLFMSYLSNNKNKEMVCIYANYRRFVRDKIGANIGFFGAQRVL